MENRKIVALAVDNIMRVKTANIEINRLDDKNVVIIGGDNGEGKTSLLESIAMALGGKKTFPPKPIQDGADDAHIVLELDDIIITLHFTANDKSYLKVTSKDAIGATYASPQTLLDKLYSSLTFDPLAFTKMEAAGQSETLRRLVGLDFSELERERASVFERRRDVNREHKREQAVLKGLPHHKDATEKVVSVSALMEELQALETINKEYAEERADKKTQSAAFDEQLSQITNQEEAIADLNRQLEEAELDLCKMETKRDEMLSEMASWLPTPDDEDLEPIKKQIRDAEGINEKVKDNIAFDATSGRVDDLAKDADKLTKEIEAVDAKKAAMLRDAKFPIEGLTFSDSMDVVYKGFPFVQCSQAEQLRVSVAMGLALNPELRVLLVRDGSLLDKKNLALIAEMATEADAQVWIERVGDGEECSVIMIDGEATEPAGGAE